MLENIYMNSRFKKRTKIVATLGPVSTNYETIVDLVYAGVNVFRINFSHGDHQTHQQTISLIQKFRKEHKIRPSILADLQGPKIRLGENINEQGNDGIAIEEGEEVIFTTKKEKANPLEKKFLIKLDSFAEDVELNHRILIDDGKISFEVLETDKKDTVKLKALNEGLVKSKKGVNMPDTDIKVPSLTKKDLKDLDFILTQDIDWLALSFVRKEADITNLRNRIEDKRPNLKIIAKIEKPEAINNIDEIIDVTDGIMVARGDLGVEIPFEQVPVLQKTIVRKCIEQAKPVIIATQVMESMIKNPMPTRAEITDVANAVLEGADAVMLSGETSVGDYPVEVVQTITKTVLEIEKMDKVYNKGLATNDHSSTFLADAVCYNAAKISKDLNADALVVMTKSGFTARMVASYRPKAPIYAFTDREEIMSRMSLLWGVQTFYYDGKVATDEALPEINNILKIKGLLEKGNVVINTASMPIHSKGSTNMIKVSEINGNEG